ncbi:MAG: AI-2E family transporter [Faecalibacterium sp.]
MEYSPKKMKQLIGLLCFAAVLVLAILYSEQLFSAIGVALGILRPFLLGGAIAFVLNLPLRAIENHLLGRWHSKAKRPVSMILSILLVLLVFALVVLMVVPQIGVAAADVAQQVPGQLERLVAWLETLSVQYPQLTDQARFLAELEANWQAIVQNLFNVLRSGMGSVVSTTIGLAGGLISSVTDVVIGFVFSLYILSQKETLGDQGSRILSAYLPRPAAQYARKVCALLYKNFSSFVTGQCLEAVILGSMFVVSMAVLRMPYAVMIGVLIGFTALIPIVGAFIGCIVGALLILLENPMQAVAFVILFLVLQQLEGNLIYPRVVGSSVGLPSIWVLAAVTIGGSMFGILGMLVFIPLLSTVYALVRDSVNARNAAKAAAEAAPPVPEETGTPQAE